VNFRFWRVDGDKVITEKGVLDGAEFGGSMYMWRALRRAVAADPGLLDADRMAGMTSEQFAGIFTDDHGYNPLNVGSEDRVTNIRDLGKKLSADWDGQFYNLAEAAGGSLVEFSKHSRKIRAFDDPIQKLTMVNAILHSGSGVHDFDDKPIPGIDYHLLRHALRQGIVVPSEQIGQKLENSQWLSTEEAGELRRITLLAFNELSKQTGIDGEVLDNKYWLNRKNCTDPGPVCADPDQAHKCPFAAGCKRKIAYQLPLERTRFY
jgi:hypothetical protein